MSDTRKDNMGQVAKKTEVRIPNDLNGFFKNKYHNFLVLKSEKLASAVYLITNFVPESDPIRTRLRTSAIDLFSATTRYGFSQEGTLDLLQSRCLEIGVLLATAERAGLVSSMNARILSEEYGKLGVFVREHYGHINGVPALDVIVPAVDSEVPPKIQGRETHTSGKYLPTKRTNNNKRHQTRRDSILSLFNKKDSINVKDAAEAIEGCSEKTIQRELLSMVEDGVLLKEGERRWSVYKKAP